MKSSNTRSAVVPLGIVVAREEVDNPWLDYAWRPTGVIVGAPDVAAWKELKRGPGWVHYYAATVPLELHRKETEAYRVNLQNEQPAVYVVLREAETDDSERPVEVHLATVSAFEAQDYLDSGEDIVEPVPMPETLIAWIKRFVDDHHVEEKFKKRKRDEVDIEDHKFGKEPIFLTPRPPKEGGEI